MHSHNGPPSTDLPPLGPCRLLPYSNHSTTDENYVLCPLHVPWSCPCTCTRRPGTSKAVRRALRGRQLLSPFTLDVGGDLLEGQPFASDPRVAPFLFASFTAFLDDRQRQHVQKVRRRVHGALWEALGAMALEGVGLAKRLQGPSATREVRRQHHPARMQTQQG